MNNQHFLAVTAIGSSDSGVLETFAQISKQCGCNILESYMTTMGEQCALMLHMAGSWNSIAKIETMFPIVSKKHRFAIQANRTHASAITETLPYMVVIYTPNRVGVLNDLTRFFNQYNIKVERMECKNHVTKNHSLINKIIFEINIPFKAHLATLREKFMLYCDEKNLDASFEPNL